MAGLRPAPALTHGARATAELLERFGLTPDKSLGQHFLIDPNQVERIVALAQVNAGDRVVEVGPGLGALTAGLLDAGAEVVAVEVDEGLAGALDAQFSHRKLRLVRGDALTVDWHDAAPAPGPWAMIANLPYNVATPLVMDVLDEVPQIERLLVMVQREVAERFAAPVGSKDHGLPSVKVAYWGHASVLARVPATVFLPPPRVESALVLIERDPTLVRDASVDEVFALARPAYGQRRKMLRRSLRSLVTAEAFAAADVAPDERPEQLDIEAWCRLAVACRRQ